MVKKHLGGKPKSNSADFKMATPSTSRRLSQHASSAATPVGKRTNGATKSSTQNAKSDNHETRTVIVNELLCFVWNKMDILPYDTIVKLCSDVFDDDEVADAKSVLFGVCASADSVRKITRKGADKLKHNLHDILNLLHETEPSDTPCFAAADLSKLPPVHYNHMDMSVILKELELVKGDIAELKLAQVATLEICREQPPRAQYVTRPVVASSPGAEGVRTAADHRDAADMGSCMAITGAAPGCTRAEDAVGSPVADLDATTCSENNAISVPSDGEPEKEDGELDDSITEVKQLLVGAAGDPPAPVRTTSPSFAGLAAGLAVQGMKSGPRASDEEFTVVSRRKKPVVIGTARSSALRGVKSRLTSTHPTAAAFVTRLAPGTSEADMCDYVRSVFCIDVCCEELKARYDTYASFKLVVKGHNLAKLMN
jgi:hypothetical protein